MGSLSCERVRCVHSQNSHPELEIPTRPLTASQIAPFPSSPKSITTSSAFQHPVAAQRLGDRGGALIADFVIADVEGFQHLVDRESAADRLGLNMLAFKSRLSRSALKLENLIKSGPTGLAERDF